MVSFRVYQGRPRIGVSSSMSIVELGVNISTVATAAELFRRPPDERVVPELIAFHDFLTNPPALTRVSGGGATQAPAVALPSWRDTGDVVLKGQLSMRFHPEAPGEYYRAEFRTPSNEGFEYRFVVRPEARYVMVAGYFYRGPRIDAADVVKCISLRFLRLRPQEDRWEMLKRLFGRENKYLQSPDGKRLKGVLEISDPVAGSIHASVGDGSFECEIDPNTLEATVENKVRAGRPLTRDESAAARELMKVASLGLKPAQGPRPRLSEAQAQRFYEELLPACDRLLSGLQGKRWPPFRRTFNAESFVARFVHGQPEVMDALVKELFRGHRRPSAHRLSQRAVSRLSGLTIRRLQQLIRK